MNVQEDINIKASDISISYAHYQKLFEKYNLNNPTEINLDVKPDIKMTDNKIASYNSNAKEKNVYKIILPPGIKIDRTSDIIKYVDTYKSNAVIAEDHKDHLKVLDQSNSSLLKSLQIAQQKFPGGICVNGDNDFRNKVIRVAAQNNIALSNLSDLEKALYAEHKPNPLPVQKPIKKPDLVRAKIANAMPHWQMNPLTKVKTPASAPSRSGGRER